mmetsp:Transcript_2682/g.6262  ORF Transcript_2682/g.6262 Transcript_2682/m.6262 type:complete len:191 (+) Transcript_2682:293-865(+)|eukprot:g5694.t1
MTQMDQQSSRRYRSRLSGALSAVFALSGSSSILVTAADTTIADALAGEQDCLVNSLQPKCCPMSTQYGSTLDDGSPCLFLQPNGQPSVGNQGEVCTGSCELKYKSLGYDCWFKHNQGVDWGVMQRLCDPQNNYFINGYFDPPTTSPPGTGVDPSAVSSATTSKALTSSVATSLLCALGLGIQGAKYFVFG